MPRHKQRDKHLPPRMRKHGRFHYHVSCAGGREVWTPLGDDYVQALLKWRSLEGLCEGAETVAQMLDNALAEMIPSLKPGSVREYTRNCNTLKPAFKDFMPADVRPVHISQYLAKRSSKVSANREITFFQAAWNVARRKGWLDLPNPCAGIERNQERDRKRTAKPHEVRALLFDKKGKRRDCVEADAVEFALMTGVREADQLHLAKHQIEPSGIRFKPRKTDASTEAEIFFPWNAALDACVKRLLARRRRVGSIYLLPVQRGKRAGQPYSAPSWHKVWRAYFTECGVEGLTWNDLRRTALNRRKKESGSDAAKDMGAHGSVTTTEMYLTNTGATEVPPLKISGLYGIRAEKRDLRLVRKRR